VLQYNRKVVANASEEVILVTVPQASVAVAEPSAPVIAAALGLQPRVTLEYVPVNVGGVWSEVQLTVLVIVAELPQLSVAINVLTCDTVQPEVVAVASEEVILVTVPQASVAVAEPRAPVIAAALGLQPRVTLEYVPVNVGGVWSEVQLTVLVIVAELPQLSVAINVLICDTVQPEVVAVASEEVILVTVPQASVAVAEPRAPVIAAALGLQPRVTLEYVPVNVGGV
jgi:hypothetical protein